MRRLLHLLNNNNNNNNKCQGSWTAQRTLRYCYMILIITFFITIPVIKAEDDTSNDTGDIDGDTIRNFELNISLTLLNPDCFNESYPMLVINNQFPGPALHVVKNDIVKIRVRNSIENNNNQSSSIHFHGIRQYGTTFSDGVASITQLAIAPGTEFIQEFQVLNQAGTYYYHAHVGVQDDSIQGPFIVHETEASLLSATTTFSLQKTVVTEGSSTYDGEHILQWTEFWHQSAYNRQQHYMSPQFINDNGPDSVLLNGKTIYDINHIGDKECKGLSIIDVEPNKTYRLRFIGALTFRILGIFIQQHNMTLIEIDGEYVEPYDIKFIEIGPGQRMSVLIHTGNYSIGTLFPIASNFRWKNGVGYTKNGYGYLRYISPSATTTNTIIMEMPSISSFPVDIFPTIEAPGWVLSQVKPWVATDQDTSVINALPDQTIKLSMAEVIETDNTTRYRNNGRKGVLWGSPTASLLDQVISGTLGSIGELSVQDGFSTAHQTYPLDYGQIIDIVFQNKKIPAGLCVAHPWHTHGHSHYLLAEGPGEYEHERDQDIRTFDTPLLKDVSMTYPSIVNGSTGCGWTKVRIFTDNPGIWAVHCHITSHMLQGKMVVFEVAADMILSTRRTFASS